MKSPFPGMDPFIEGCGLWEDFHSHLIEHIYARLADAVPAKYTVRTGERAYVVLVDTDGEHPHPFKPDVGIRTAVTPDDTGAAAGATAVAEPATETGPLTMRALLQEEFRETFIEIRDADPEGRLITSIEVLSPTNKKPNSPGWDLYQRKRQALLMPMTANLVEVDLLRGGQRLPMVDPWPTSPYTLLVARRHSAPYCQVWPAFSLRPLPSIPVPLLKPDADIPLDLQPMVEAIYARSRYGKSISYSRRLTPPLTPEEAESAERHLRMPQEKNDA